MKTESTKEVNVRAYNAALAQIELLQNERDDLVAVLQSLAAIGEGGVIERRETGKPTWHALDAVKNIARAAISTATSHQPPTP